MAQITYSYRTVQVPASAPFPQGQTLHKPMTIATLTAASGERLRCLVLLDTGADSCVFPLAMAIALKIDVLSLPKNITGGVGSNSNVTYYDNLSIDLDNGVVFSAYVGFTEGMDPHGIGLLGQEGFFDRYDVTFSHRGKTATLEV